MPHMRERIPLAAPFAGLAAVRRRKRALQPEKSIS